MFTKHSSKGFRKCDNRASGVIDRFPESQVNPMYKPRTLAELKALFDHTGINPAPVPLNPAVPEMDGLDPMDTPPRPIGGDTFETIRTGKELESEMKKASEDYKKSVDASKVAKESVSTSSD